MIDTEAERADQTLHAMIYSLGWNPCGCRLHTFAEPASSEVAIAGKDGQRAADLLSASKAAGIDVLASLTAQAIRRLLVSPNPQAETVLFDDEELKHLAASLAATIATADLLGRARMHGRAQQEIGKQRAQAFAEWDPDKHPRGEPGNAGQFAPSGGGGSGTTEEPKELAPGKTKGIVLGKEKMPKSKAEIKYLSTIDSDPLVKERAENLLSKVFGTKTPEESHAALAASLGMPDDAVVKIADAGKFEGRYSDDLPMPGAIGVRVFVEHPSLSECSRFIGIDGDGKKFIKNEVIVLKSRSRGNGLGTDIFAKQVESAADAGIEYIATHAATGGDKSMNGYATWPKLGYDQSLNDPSIESKEDKAVFAAAKKQFPKAKTVLDIITSPGGAEWWGGKKNPDGSRSTGNGTDLYNARFSLTPDSPSIRMLQRQMEKRESTPTKPPTSPAPSSTPSIPSAMKSPAKAGSDGASAIRDAASKLIGGASALETVRRAPRYWVPQIARATGIKPEQVSAALGVAFAEGDPPNASDPNDPFAPFPGPIPAQPPEAAVNYFARLVPSLYPDPFRYGPLLQRHAFTLAYATDQTLLAKVKGAIADRLAGAKPGSTATADIQDLLDAAGVSPKNPQYAEMCYRTNMMDAYNAGQTAELQDPAMQEFFPWWRYEGILDSRTGDDHRPKIGKYYPVTATFAAVRGPRVFNCRCGQTPLYKTDVEDLIAKGVRAETSW